MNNQHTPIIVAVFILIIGSAVIIRQNNSLANVELEKEHFLDTINDQSVVIQELEAEITELSLTIDYLNDTLSFVLQSVELEKELETSTYVNVIQPRNKVTYTFEEKMNYTYSVNYSFPQSKTVIFSVLDTDKKSVLGYSTLELVGQGIKTINVEIPIPRDQKTWEVYPSAYWFNDETPRFSEKTWSHKAVINILDATPGHTQGSCSGGSSICHSG